MKVSIGLFFCFMSMFVLTSCDVVHFNRYPGIAQDTIAQELRGEFKISMMKSPKDIKDTLTLYIGKNSYTKIEKEKVEIIFLSDSLVFSNWKGNYFLSEKHLGFWTCIFLKADGKDVIAYYVEVNEKDDAGRLKKLSKYFENVKQIQDGDRKIFSVDMNEAKLLKFVSKELRKKGIKLKRIES